MDYHRLSKLDERSRAIAPDPSLRVSPHRVFDYAPEKIDLSPRLLDVRMPVLPLLERGLDAVPESLHGPKQDLRTLSTWLYMAAGLRDRQTYPWGVERRRPFPSADATYPLEFYVAAFAIEGLSPGLYHFSPREYSLRKLREGPETLSLLRRGRPDLHFLSTVPAALLVSTVFCRAGWTQGRRGYRQAVIEAGHAVANCHAVAMGLGISTHVRLRLNENCTRELIGLPEDFDYVSAESVQAMVIWADEATAPMDTSPRAPSQTLELLPRPHSGEPLSYGSVLAVHQDILARGVVGRDVRPPLTELSPLPQGLALVAVPRAREEVSSKSLRNVLLTPPDLPEAFDKKPISRDLLAEMTVAAFRGGTYFPLKCAGPHLALVRPFWVVQNVSGLERGVWGYDPISDRWSLITPGDFRQKTGPLTRDRTHVSEAAAVCVMVADLHDLLAQAGPDLYRLAHLEAGLAAQRLHLSAAALGLASRSHGDFFDEPWRQFLGLALTPWEPLLVTAVGSAVTPPTAPPLPPEAPARSPQDEITLDD